MPATPEGPFILNCGYDPPLYGTVAVIHIPHASRCIPAEERAALCLSDVELSAELLKMTDAYTDELFAVDTYLAPHFTFPISRLVVDPERFVDDAVEPMAERGMGVVYTRTATGAPLRRHLDPETRDRLLAWYYRPHHHQLDLAVSNILQQGPSCLVVDAHSFPSIPLPYEFDQSRDRPDICIGTADFHSPPALVDFAVELCEQAGFRVAVNRPFAGAMVPARYYKLDRRVMVRGTDED